MSHGVEAATARAVRAVLGATSGGKLIAACKVSSDLLVQLSVGVVIVDKRYVGNIGRVSLHC